MTVQDGLLTALLDFGANVLTNEKRWLQIAVRLLSTRLLARSRTEGGEAVESFDAEALALRETELGRPKRGWTNQSVLIAKALLSGFLARKGDGLPGWQTIWRGSQRLMWMCGGVVSLNQTQNDVGNDKPRRGTEPEHQQTVESQGRVP